MWCGVWLHPVAFNLLPNRCRWRLINKYWEESHFSSTAAEQEGFPSPAVLLLQWLTCSFGLLLQLFGPPIRHSCILPLFFVHLLCPSSVCCPSFVPFRTSIYSRLLSWRHFPASLCLRSSVLHFKLQSYQIRCWRLTCPTDMSLQLQQKEGAPFMVIPAGPSSTAWVYVCTRKCVSVCVCV